jgi:hypothetical protein
MRKWILLFLMVLAGLTGTVPVAAQKAAASRTPPEFRALPNVVFIETECVTGTAFYTGKRLTDEAYEVVTISHLLDPLKRSADDPAPCISRGKKVQVDDLPAVFLEKGTHGTLFFSAPLRPGRKIAELRMREAVNGELVASFGNGHGWTNVMMVGKVDLTVDPKLGARFFIADFSSSIGTSGAPIVAISDGALVGMLTGSAAHLFEFDGYPFTQDVTFVLRSKYVMQDAQAFHLRHPIDLATARSQK